MNIGIVPDPVNQPDWPAIKAFLEPAAKRGGVPVLEKDEVVWSIYDETGLIGAVTARVTLDGFGEIVLVGGRDRKKWLAGLDRLLGKWLAREGMKSMRAYGRIGWRRELEALGWRVIGLEGKNMGFERVLT